MPYLTAMLPELTERCSTIGRSALLKRVTHVRVAGTSHADLFWRDEAKRAFRDFLAAL